MLGRNVGPPPEDDIFGGDALEDHLDFSASTSDAGADGHRRPGAPSSRRGPAGEEKEADVVDRQTSAAAGAVMRGLLEKLANGRQCQTISVPSPIFEANLPRGPPAARIRPDDGQ